MPVIMIVDRAEEEREMLRDLLQGRDGWKIREEGSAAEAREGLHEEPIDMVLVDLSTAGPREERFLEHLREDWPQIPTVLLTTDADENEVMVEALGIGAASYVPKSMIARDLVVTIDRLLGLAGCRRRHAKLLDCLSHTECQLNLSGNELSMLPVLIGYLVDTAEDFGVANNGNRMQLSVALQEALSNAIIHGNLEVSSDLREGNGSAFEDLIQQRREQPPYSQRRVEVHGAFRDREARFSIRDEGPGFDTCSTPDPTSLINVEKPHGRGLFLIHAFMDEVLFNDEGNQITIVKRARK